MRFAEKVVVVFALIGIITQYFHVAGAAFLSLVAMGSLFVFYVLFGAFINNGITGMQIFRKDSYRGINGLQLIFGAIGGIAQAVLIASVWIKTQHWTGAAINLLFSILPGVILLVLLLITKLQKHKTLCNNLLYRSLGQWLFLIGSAFIS